MLMIDEWGRDKELCLYRGDDDDPCFEHDGCMECPYNKQKNTSKEVEK